MIKALYKKEFLRLLASLSNIDKKKKSKRTISVTGLLIWASLFIALAMIFTGIYDAIGEVLIPKGAGWVYFSIVAVFNFALNLFGSGLTAYSTLYKAKDNEALLALPIPVTSILTTRVVIVFFTCVLYTCITMFSSLYVYHKIEVNVSLLSRADCAILILFSAILMTSISCLVGLIASAISRRIVNKGVATVSLILTILSVYYYLFFNAKKYLAFLGDNISSVADSLTDSILAWPFYMFGITAVGDKLALLLYSLFTCLVMIVSYEIVSKTFITAVTTNDKQPHNHFYFEKQNVIKVHNVHIATLKKEWNRFTASSTYMLNCGMGLLLSAIITVATLLKSRLVIRCIQLIPVAFSENEADIILNALPVIIIGVIWMILSTINTSAPSMSLEGKNFWIIKMLPIKPQEVFLGKELLQVCLSMAGASMIILALTLVLRFNILYVILFLIASYAFARFDASLGILLGLRFINLNWTNESQPIKQNVAPLLQMVFSVLIVTFMLLIYAILNKFISPVLFICIASIIFIFARILLDTKIEFYGKKVLDKS